MLEYHKEDEALLIRNLVTGQPRLPPASCTIAPRGHPLPLSPAPSTCCVSDALPGEADAGLVCVRRVCVRGWGGGSVAHRALGSCFPRQPGPGLPVVPPLPLWSHTPTWLQRA